MPTLLNILITIYSYLMRNIINILVQMCEKMDPEKVQALENQLEKLGYFDQFLFKYIF